MTDNKAQDHSAKHYIENDEKLKGNKDFAKLHEQFSKLASDDSVNKTAKALEAKGHKVTIVDAKDFVKTFDAYIPAGASYSASGSTGLDQIGWSKHMQANPDKWNNIKGKAIAHMMKGDMAGYAQTVTQGLTADYFVASVAAATEEGDLIEGSASFRTPLFGPKNLVFFVTTQKIVPDLTTGLKRLTDYVYQLESARARVAYKVPGSLISEITILKAPSPYGPKTHVFLVKGHFGY